MKILVTNDDGLHSPGLWSVSARHCSRMRGVEAMKFLVTVQPDEDGVFIVECPSIPGCISQGNTREEALDNIKDAIRE